MIHKINHNEKLFFHRHIHDVERIKNILLKNGYVGTLDDCSDLWLNHSSSYAASWLLLPEDDNELWNILRQAI